MSTSEAETIVRSDGRLNAAGVCDIFLDAVPKEIQQHQQTYSFALSDQETFSFAWDDSKTIFRAALATKEPGGMTRVLVVETLYESPSHRISTLLPHKRTEFIHPTGSEIILDWKDISGEAIAVANAVASIMLRVRRAQALQLQAA